MDKRPNFLGDVAAVNDSLQDVGSIIAAANNTKTIDIKPRRETAPTAAPETVSKATRPEEPRASRPRPRSRPEPPPPVVLLNVTTRLSRETNDALTAASLHQRLKKLLPATRQDIMEEALGDWLRRHGYASRKPSSTDDADPAEDGA